MQLNTELCDALAQVAWRYEVEVELLQAALEHESAAELAAVLGLDQLAADAHMARIRRAVMVQGDIGAGCRLLTDDVQAELLAALAEL